MTVALVFEASDGEVRVCLTSSYDGDPRFPLDSYTTAVEYVTRCKRMQRRNPDMTPRQVHTCVLDRWYEEIATREGMRPRWMDQ